MHIIALLVEIQMNLHVFCQSLFVKGNGKLFLRLKNLICNKIVQSTQFELKFDQQIFELKKKHRNSGGQKNKIFLT